MVRSRFYQYTTIILLVLNIVVISLLFIGRPDRSPRQEGPMRPFNRAIDVLKLDKEQHEIFFQSARRHDQDMEDISFQQRELLETYFSTLIIPESNSQADSILQQVQQLESQKIQSTYQHFEEVKELLREDQIPNFEVFINNMLKMILNTRGRRLPPPRKHK